MVLYAYCYGTTRIINFTLHLPGVDASNPVQHSHDFFVISSCAVHGKLLPNPATQASSSALDGGVRFLQLPL